MEDSSDQQNVHKEALIYTLRCEGNAWFLQYRDYENERDEIKAILSDLSIERLCKALRRMPGQESSKLARAVLKMANARWAWGQGEDISIQDWEVDQFLADSLEKQRHKE